MVVWIVYDESFKGICERSRDSIISTVNQVVLDPKLTFPQVVPAGHGKSMNCGNGAIILDATVSDVSFINPTHTDTPHPCGVQYNYVSRVRVLTSCFSR